MADYIYLLQNRLTPAQWRALEAVREAARGQSMPVFLVGGAVRDLTTGTPVRDLDFALQGDARALVGELEGKGAAEAGENQTLGSVYLTFRGGVRVEITPTQTVTYPKPGQAHTTPAPILDDLRRRDFTANAMAISLNEGSYGLLLDPLNGTADIENRELRLVSAYGFIEQPALLLRATRLGERLGWNLEARTKTRYDNSKEEEHIKSLPEADRRYELEEIFHEEDPLSTMEHMAAEGWISVLFPAIRATDGDRNGLEEIRELAGQLEGQGLHPDTSAVFFPLTIAKMSEQDRKALKASFARPGFVQRVDSLETRSKELASQLTSKAAASPSDTWRLIHEADPEVMLYLSYHSRSGAVQAKIKAFLKDWPQMRQKIPYALMQEMRITPELPGYDKLLDDLFFALIDGKLDSVEATRAFLEPFSPPAPVQVAARRRPAKATRSRSKRGAQESANESVESADTEDVEEPDRQEDEATPELTLGLDDDDQAPSLDEDDEDDLEDEEEDETDEDDEDQRPPAKRGAPAKAATKKAEPAKPVAPSKTLPKKRVEAEPAPAKVAKAAPTEPSKAISKVNAPAKAMPAGKASAAKEPVKATGTVKEPAKQAIKNAAKGAPPAKQVIKVVPAKAVAKKEAAKAAPPAAAKKAVPVKAAKKAAVKGKGGR